MYTRITRHTGEPTPRLALIATLVGLLVAFAVAGTARAAADGIVVRYHAAELQDDLRARELYERIEAAAERSCRVPGLRSLALRKVDTQCIREALDVVVRTIDSPVLSGIHAATDGSTRLARR